MTDSIPPENMGDMTALATARDAATSEDLATAERDALAAADRAGVRIRELGELTELEDVYRLFDRIWHPDPSNPPVTTELLRALTKAGNYVSGAYDGTDLVGACVGFFGAPCELSLHSHIAGVTGAARGRTIGFAIKLHQRQWALRRGVHEIAWTFDPLVRRNAYFNLVKLAAAPAEYLHNFYGDVHDGINGSDGTDRLLVAWSLTGPAVTAACRGESRSADADLVRAAGAAVGLGISERGEPVPGSIDADAVLVAVPPDVESLRHSDPARAGRWRRALREVLGALMSDGARVTGFDRAGWYVLDRRRDQ